MQLRNNLKLVHIVEQNCLKKDFEFKGKLQLLVQIFRPVIFIYFCHCPRQTPIKIFILSYTTSILEPLCVFGQVRGTTLDHVKYVK